jgi:hypothetical protein
MSIVASVRMVGHAQADGRRYVRETHTDHLGNVYVVDYGPVAGDTNYDTVMSDRAAAIENYLAEQEAQGLLDGD